MRMLGRRQVLGWASAGGLAALTGCGFSPVYQSGSGSVAKELLLEMAKVDIEVIPDREGQMLRNFLFDRMQPRGQAKKLLYSLKTRVNVTTRDLGVQLDETTARSRVDINASYTLSGNGVSRTFTSRSASSFSTVDVEYASLVAEQDAIERSLRTIADEMTVRVAAVLKAHLLTL